MKKTDSKILAFCSILALLSALFFSCHGVIFDEIRKEVKLADAKVSGDIENIVRYRMKSQDSDGNPVELEYVFTTTGKIYYRNIDTEHDYKGNKVGDEAETTQFSQSAANQKKTFSTFKKPSGYVQSLAADSQYLYAFSLTIEDDDDGDNVPTKTTLSCYDSESGEWTQIWSESYSSTSKILMSTNTPQNEHRQAFFRYGTTIWNLSGTTELTEENARTDTVQSSDIDTDSGDKFANYDNKTTPTYSSKSCAYFGGEVYFSSSNAMTTDETFTDDATHMYYSSGDNIYYYPTKDSEWSSGIDLSCDTIYSLAVTFDYLLAGTSGGIVHTPWESEGVPKAGTADFKTNADSTLSSYYEINALLVIEPSLPEYDTTIFASSVTSSSSASFNNIGLWSYFDSEGEWNRE